MKKLTRDHLTFFFDKDIPPVMTVKPGEIFAVETEDAIAGQLTPETVNRMTHAEMKANVPCSNPVTGPIVVTGAEPGDCLEVEILDIQVADYAWTIFDGTGGLLTNPTTLNTPLPEQNMILPVQDNQLLFDFGAKQIRVPLQPAIGTIGVAPQHERHYAFLNGNDYLGNVDIPELGVGKILRLPVHVPGALLSLGDIH
ncbi:acetamidase/formamidase family protein, partial [bacterium]|nr:acetamidase/formamidase family protein [bacterium]